MTQQENETTQHRAGRADEDLSAEIVSTVKKTANERVTCSRVSDRDYRCNWWSAASDLDYDNPGMKGLLVTTHRVSRSEFLRVTRNEGGLLIEKIR